MIETLLAEGIPTETDRLGSMSEYEAEDPAAVVLTAGEQRAVTRRIALALAAGGLLILSWFWRVCALGNGTLSDVLAGFASLIVAPSVFAGAWHSLKSPSLHGVTDRLIALAMLAAWAVGDMTTAALLPVVMAFGHALEERSVLGTREAIRALGRLTEGKVRRVTANGHIENVPYEMLQVGDLIDVVAGTRIPADGIVRHGQSNVDNGAITGESMPQEVAHEARVFGGAMNLDGPLRIEITHVGAQSALGRIIALMREAECTKPPVTQLLERYMGAYLALVLLIASLVWFVLSDASAMLAVIVAACPCALVLAAPATAIAGIAAGARRGILFRSAAFLDRIAELDTLVIDKTGTLTYGELRVEHIWPGEGVGIGEALELGAKLGAGSMHPVSHALCIAYAVHAGRATATHTVISALEPLTDVRELRGAGIVATTPAGTAVLGRAELLREYVNGPLASLNTFDGPCVGLALDGRLMAWFGFTDVIRPEACEALADLRELGLMRQTLLTGDREAVARRLAAQAGIERVVADALPHDKLTYVTGELEAGRHPLVVGDGLNDVLAIKAGSVSIAMGERGIDIAVASADVVLLGDDLRGIATCVRLGRRCRRSATYGAAFGLLWTVAVIALAAGGFLGAVWAAVLHNVGTFAVIANAGRLLRDEHLGQAIDGATNISDESAPR
jgi:Zn2+/Cd2+-exporting ATPase